MESISTIVSMLKKTAIDAEMQANNSIEYWGTCKCNCFFLFKLQQLSEGLEELDRYSADVMNLLRVQV